MPLDLLLFVEDPGAANLTIGIPAAFERNGRSAAICATGSASGYLDTMGQQHADCPAGASHLDELRPTALAIGTSEQADSAVLPLVIEARTRGIPTIGLIDAPANADRRFRGNTDEPLAYLPDHLIVVDEASREAFLRLGVTSNRIHVAENPRFEQVRRKALETTPGQQATLRRKLAGDVHRPLIVFLSELSTGLNPDDFARSDDYSLHGRGQSKARTCIVLEELLDAVRDIEPNPAIILRLHPKDTRDAYLPYAPELAGINMEGDAIDICLAADLVIGMTTSLLTECRHMGQRVISILPRRSEQEWLADTAAGRIRTIWQSENIAPAIRRMLGEHAGTPTRAIHTSMSDTLLSLLPRMADRTHP